MNNVIKTNYDTTYIQTKHAYCFLVLIYQKTTYSSEYKIDFMSYLPKRNQGFPKYGVMTFNALS